MRFAKTFGGVVGAAFLTLGLLVFAEHPEYVSGVEGWRAEYEARLKSDTGWLTVSGLYWLREGENWIGTDTTNDFVLPEGAAPGTVGVFEYRSGKVTFRAESGVDITQDGKPVGEIVLERGEDHALTINDLKLWVHHSGERLAIRVRDLAASLRKEFTGVKWFPVDTRFRVEADFTPHPEPKTIEMLNILGDIETYKSPGYVDFALAGESIRLEPLEGREGGLWIIFRDGTSGVESYPAARFIRTDPPVDGRVVIDFNRTYNPPCAYNPHTTCPMPTKQNRLKVRIEAGEKKYKEHS